MLELPEDAGEGWSGEAVPGALSFEPEEYAARGSSREEAAEAAGPALHSLDAAHTRAESEAEAAEPVSAAGAAPAEDGWDVSKLDADWQAFAAMLGPAERDMIRAVLLDLGDAERMAIAGLSGELPETMIDRINEAAMEAIGDLLIDAGEVLDEYLPNLDGLRAP